MYADSYAELKLTDEWYVDYCLASLPTADVKFCNNDFYPNQIHQQSKRDMGLTATACTTIPTDMNNYA